MRETGGGGMREIKNLTFALEVGKMMVQKYLAEFITGASLRKRLRHPPASNAENIAPLKAIKCTNRWVPQKAHVTPVLLNPVDTNAHRRVICPIAPPTF